MKIIFAGGRDFKNLEVVNSILAYLYDKALVGDDESFTCISGNARGADLLFAQELRKYGIPVEEYPAKWNDLSAEPCIIKVNNYKDNYNALAGHNRNTLMAEKADMLVCVYNGSPGTKHMISAMRKLEKPVIVFDYDGVIIKI